MTHGFSKLLFSYQKVDQKVIALHIMNRIIEIVNGTLVPPTLLISILQKQDCVEEEGQL